MNAKAASNGGLSAFGCFSAFQKQKPMDISGPTIKIKDRFS
jgi:hypothetical protein